MIEDVHLSENKTFSEDEVRRLNEMQALESFHGLTCGKCSDYPIKGHHTYLAATKDGLVCPNPECDYIQKWAPIMSQETLDAFKEQDNYWKKLAGRE